jgi:hypothetical protein
MALLLAGAQWVLPGWIGSFRLALAAYREYTGSQVSVLATVTSPAVGAILGVAAVVTLAFVCWRRRHESAATPAFALVCSLILAGTLVIIPMTALYNQVLLLPGLLFLAWNVPFFRKRDILTRSSCFVAALLFFWPMLAAVTLTTASFFLPPGSVQKAWSAPLWSSMMTPVVVLLLLVPLAATVLREER